MPNFIVISDENYAVALRVSLKKIQEFYPDSRIFLYDWGLESATRTAFQDEIKRLTIVDWTQKIQNIRRRITYRVARNLLSLIGRGRWVDRRIFERLLLQKPECFRHCSDVVGDELLFFFDADVVLLEKLDEIVESQFDLIFTLRREHEFDFSINNCQVLNSGVIFFGSDRNKRNLFLDQWIRRANETREYLHEQTALTRMFEEHGRAVFKQYSSFSHNINGADFAIKFFPCEIYNFNWISEAVANPQILENIKLLHFKGRRHDPIEFNKFMSQLRIC